MSKGCNEPKKGGRRLDLTQPNNENLAFILTDLKKKLKIVNESLIDPADFRLDDY